MTRYFAGYAGVNPRGSIERLYLLAGKPAAAERSARPGGFKVTSLQDFRSRVRSAVHSPIQRRRRLSWPGLIVLLALALITSGAAATDFTFRWANPTPQGNTLWAMAFEDSLIGYAIGDRGASMRTDDGGQTWIDQTPFPDFTYEMKDLLILGPGDLLAVGESPGIFRSTDGGVNWITVANPSTETLNNIVAIAGDTLSAAGDLAQIIRSTDGGNTWSLFPTPGGPQIFDQHWWNGEQGYVVGVHVASQTLDGGQNWSPIPDVTNASFYTEIHFLDSLNGWLVEHFTTWRTIDGGATWFEKHGEFPNSPFYQHETVFIDSVHRFIATHLEGALIWETLDDGLTWEKLYERNRTNGYPDIELLSNGALVVCSSDGDHLRSTDMGQSWVNFAQSPEADERSVLETITFLPGGNAFAGGRDSLWLRSVDGGMTWEIPAANPGTWITKAIEFHTDEFGLTGGYRNFEPSHIMRTTDGGNSWVKHLLAGSFMGYPEGIAVPDDSVCYVFTTSGNLINYVFRSLDGGQSWAEINNGIPTMGNLECIFFVNADTGYVAGGTVGGDPMLWRTIDRGDSWTLLPSDSTSFWIADMHWMNISTGVAVGGSGTFRTTDGGISWTEVLDGKSHHLDFHSPLYGVAADYTYRSMWVTFDGGVHWEGVDYPWSGRPEDIAAVENGFSICGSGSVILAGGFDPTTVADNREYPIRPYAPGSLRNSPNPFNPKTTIHYANPEEGRVTLTLYDLAGRRISVLTDGVFPAGDFERNWGGRDGNGRPLPSGSYLIRLKTGEQVETRKITLVR